MDSFGKELINVENDLKSFRVQRYSELPDIDLYMEQVVSYVNRHLEPFCRSDEYLITPSMINNYVKYGIIPSPDKKKYKRRHIAYIYAVYFLKQVLTMSEIKTIISQQLKNSDELTAYEFFCTELECALKNCCRLGADESKQSSVDNYALKYSAVAIASKLYAQRIIHLQHQEQGFFDDEPELKEQNDTVKKSDKKKVKKESKDIESDEAKKTLNQNDETTVMDDNDLLFSGEIRNKSEKKKKKAEKIR